MVYSYDYELDTLTIKAVQFSLDSQTRNGRMVKVGLDYETGISSDWISKMKIFQVSFLFLPNRF